MLFNLSRPPTALRRSTSEFLQLCRQLPSARRALYVTSRSKTMSEPKVISVEDLSSSEAKYVSVRRIHMLSEVSIPNRHGSPVFSDFRWVKLKKCTYRDPTGKEAVSGSLRNAPRVHPPALMASVAILALLRSESNKFPPSTIIIEQYRPPVDRHVVGLISEGESPEQTAIRELEEETGFKASGVVQSSPLLVSDPGMTNANMKLVTVDVPFPENLEMPAQKLDPGEFIQVRIVELAKLRAELQAYERKGFVIDAKLDHLASGFELAEKLRQPKSST
ncbi:hypothetical protein ONZ51_g12977 [Trametes cubensis]|uniref:Nudix hydrolase domain-containing protein n=1 Tax=Trametes cubensis TaxID=1111947 RepID=A0AAD7X502_9APHY|nr:hypothetical protein ONZ51_g12977 [Trametes cubensis]